MKKLTFTTRKVYGPLAAFFNSDTRYTLNICRADYADYKRITGVHVSTTLGGKMLGVHGITTTCTNNPFCLAMQNGDPDSPCAHCYATALRDNARRLFERNGELLSQDVITTVPLIESRIFRDNSHGELINDIDMFNRYLIAAANPDRSNGLWTKRPDVVARVHEMLGLPKLRNMELVLSSRKLNTPDVDPTGGLFDHVFTVYTPDYIKAHDIKVTCGARCCNACDRCYNRRTACHVAEMLK